MKQKIRDGLEKTEPEFLNFYVAILGIGFKETIPLAYVEGLVGTTTLFLLGS